MPEFMRAEQGIPQFMSAAEQVKPLGKPPGKPPASGLGTVGKGLTAAGAQTTSARDRLLAATGLPPAASTGAGDDARTGLPDLPPSQGAFSAADIIDLLRSFNEKWQDSQLRSGIASLEANRAKAKLNTDKQLKDIAEWVKKYQEAQKASKVGGIFGWVSKSFALVASIATVVVAAVGTVASGGAAAPLLVMATAGMVGAMIGMADQVSQECGGPKISIGNLMTELLGKVLAEVGVSEDKAMAVGQLLAGSSSVLCPALLLIEPSLLADFGVGIGQLAGADESEQGKIGLALTITGGVVGSGVMLVMGGGVGGASTALSTAMRLTAKVIQATNAVVGGVLQVSEGVIRIQGAEAEKESQEAVASRGALTAKMLALQQESEDIRADLQKLMQQMQDGMRIAIQIIRDSESSLSQMNANIGRRAIV